MPPANYQYILLLRFIFILSLIAISPSIRAQRHIEDSLIRSCNAAKTDLEQIDRYGRLSDYYYANKDFSKGDSLIERQLMMAEATLDRKLILFVLFGNAGYRATGTATKDRSKNTIVYVKRALEYAKANELSDYEALAYSNLAALYNTDGQLNEAFKNASLAFTTALNTTNDSAKVICAIQLGNTYLQRSDVITAFKTYTNAHNIAVQQEKEILLPPVLHAFALLYKKLGNEEIARNYVFRSLAINKKTANFEGQVIDNILLSKLVSYIIAKEYLQKAIWLANQLHNYPLKIEAERILFFHMLLYEKPSYMLAYLDAQPELKNVFINTGPDYIEWMRAEIYLYGGFPDTALLYFKKAENSFNTGYDLTSKKNFFSEFTWCYQELKNTPSAIVYYQKSVELAQATADLSSLKSHTSVLKDLDRKSTR